MMRHLYEQPKSLTKAKSGKCMGRGGGGGGGGWQPKTCARPQPRNDRNWGDGDGANVTETKKKTRSGDLFEQPGLFAQVPEWGGHT